MECEGCGDPTPVEDIEMVKVDPNLGAAMCPSCKENW